MSDLTRITVTLRNDLLRDIDRLENNRSKFVADAVRSELERRRREELHRSLENPHPDTLGVAEAGFDAWAAGLPDEETESLFDASLAKPVRWVASEGWIEANK